MVRRRRERIELRHLCVFRRVAVSAPHAFEFAGRGVENDDTVIAVAIGDIKLAGLGVDIHTGGPGDAARVLAVETRSLMAGAWVNSWGKTWRVS